MYLRWCTLFPCYFPHSSLHIARSCCVKISFEVSFLNLCSGALSFTIHKNKKIYKKCIENHKNVGNCNINRHMYNWKKLMQMLLHEISSFIFPWVIFMYVNSFQLTIVCSKYRNNGKKYRMLRNAFLVNALRPFL